MSSGFQHKMYNYEVAPPAAIWEKIAAELDETELAKKIQSRLYNIQIAPPVHAWQRIAASLNETALVSDYAKKLAGIEVAPPVNVWNKIKDTLDADVVDLPKHRRFSPLMKYAAAAAIIGVLAWGGIRLINNKTTGNEVVRQNLIKPKENSETSPVNNQPEIPVETIGTTDVAAALDEAGNDAALEASKKTYAKLDVSAAHSKIKKAARFYFGSSEEDDYQGGVTRSPGINEIMPGAEIADRYIILMTPDGNIIRMSKKLSDMVCCVSGEEQDKDCIDQMKKWREKIANPAGAHSPGNFMDILSLLTSLQDN